MDIFAEHEFAPIELNTLQLGCELAQGYGIPRPMPPDQLPDWAASWQPDAAWGGVMKPGEAPRSIGK